MDRKRLAALLSTVAAVLVALVAILSPSGGGSGPPVNVTFHVNQAGDDGAPTQAVTAPIDQVQEVNRNLPDTHMRSLPPLVAQKAHGELQAAAKAAARIRATQAALPTAGATQGVPGCRTLFVQNQSSREGVRPQQIWLHYTVSHNVPGWADVLSVVHLFDTRSFQASSNFVIDSEGNCAYIVPIENKSWAQAAANRFAVSIEVIDYGNEATYMSSPGYLKLGQVSLTISQRTGIPLVQGVVNGCVPVKKGIVQHADGGLCAGGHHDIHPFDLAAVIRKIREVAQVGPLPKPVSKSARAKCTELNRNRRHTASYHRKYRLKPVAKQSRATARRSAELRASLKRGGYVCTVAGPGKRGSLTRR